MASPLTKRLPRELRNNLGKYLGMFLLLSLAIAFTTGFLVAASSIEVIGNGMRDASDSVFVDDSYYEYYYEDSPNDSSTINNGEVEQSTNSETTEPAAPAPSGDVDQFQEVTVPDV